MDDSKTQFDSKVKTIEGQMRNAGERRKEKLQKRVGTLTEEYNARTAKLKQAAALVNEAFQMRKKEEAELV